MCVCVKEGNTELHQSSNFEAIFGDPFASCSQCRIQVSPFPSWVVGSTRSPNDSESHWVARPTSPISANSIWARPSPRSVRPATPPAPVVETEDPPPAAAPAHPDPSRVEPTRFRKDPIRDRPPTTTTPASFPVPARTAPPPPAAETRGS